MRHTHPAGAPSTVRAAPALGVARLTLRFFVVGTGLVLLEAVGLVVGHDPHAPVTAAVAAAGAVTCAVLHWRGERLAMGVIHALLALSVVLVGVAAWVAPSAAWAVAVCGMCAFTTFAAVYTCSSRTAALHVAFSALVCLSVLSVREGAGPAPAVVVTSVFCAIGYVLGPLVTRASSAGVDPLTGLLNRRGHEEALEAALSDGQHGGRPLSVALIDVDHFKAVNDRDGHAAGDALLRALAAECASRLPAGLHVARVGGDEFVVVLPGVHGHEVVHALGALLEAPVDDAHVPPAPPGGPVRPGERARWGDRLSTGVAERRSGESASSLMRRADTALYQAKGTGRARVVVAGARDALAADLAAALATGDVRVALQPVVEVTTGAVVGVEALARWTHPDHGPVSPADFVTAAEECGLITDLGHRVLALAVEDVLRLRRHTGRPLFLTVNASGMELLRPEHAAHTLAVIARAGLPPRDLVVEVTESTLQASSTAALRTLDELRAAGVRVAVDDFGTGYSTMARLDEVPADFLKLDTTFTRGLATSPRRRAMLLAVQQMAAALGMEVVVEGVETEQDRDHVAAGGCSLAQGYFFQRPVPVQELIDSIPVAREPAVAPS